MVTALFLGAEGADEAVSVVAVVAIVAVVVGVVAGVVVGVVVGVAIDVLVPFPAQREGGVRVGDDVRVLLLLLSLTLLVLL